MPSFQSILQCSWVKKTPSRIPTRIHPADSSLDHTRSPHTHTHDHACFEKQSGYVLGCPTRCLCPCHHVQGYGAVFEEVEKFGYRIHFKKLEGEGPEEGRPAGCRPSWGFARCPGPANCEEGGCWEWMTYAPSHSGGGIGLFVHGCDGGI